MTRTLAVLLYLLVLGAAIVGMLLLETLLFTGIAITILVVLAYVALEVFAEGVFFLRQAFHYGEYRREWEQANKHGDHVS